MATRPPSRSPLGGGFVIAIGAIAGAVIGLFVRQPTIGLIVGVSAAALVAVLLWLFDRRPR